MRAAAGGPLSNPTRALRRRGEGDPRMHMSRGTAPQRGSQETATGEPSRVLRGTNPVSTSSLDSRLQNREKTDSCCRATQSVVFCRGGPGKLIQWGQELITGPEQSWERLGCGAWPSAMALWSLHQPDPRWPLQGPSVQVFPHVPETMLGCLLIPHLT